MSSFVHLHVHSEYSILDGASKISDLMAEASRLEQPALSLTDHGNLYGAYSLWRAGKQHNIKPIIGIEAYMAPSDINDKSRHSWGQLEENGRQRDVPGPYTHITLLAKNATGLRNLYRLHYSSYDQGYYYKPRLDLSLLDGHSDGLIALTGCAGGEVATRLRLGQHPEAEAAASRLKDIFAEDLFVEIMSHGMPWEDKLNGDLIGLASRLRLPVVATNDVHYTKKSDTDVHDALLCLQTHAKLNDESRFRFGGSGYYLKSYNEMLEIFGTHYSALENTLVIADRVQSYDSVFSHRNMMPVSVDGVRLRQLSYECLYNKGLHGEKEYRDRLNYEIDIIERMGYEEYFLVLADLVNWARDRGIMVGPGRGSAGGCLVAYLIGITELDPIALGLLFERFLNPSRVSPPDIDVDFQPDRRGEVIEYAISKYGKNRVAQVITFGTIKSRAALKDANRVLGGDYKEGERLVSMLPGIIRGRQSPLAGSPELIKENPEVYRLGLGLEGLIRSTGKHAAGVVISPEGMTDLIPVKRDPRDETAVAGFEQEVLEELGFIKMDLLGLDNLSILAETLRLINEEANS